MPFTTLGEGKRSQQANQTSKTETVSHHHWECRGEGMGAGWGILKGFSEEEMGLAGRI